MDIQVSIMTMNGVTDRDQVGRQVNLEKSHMHCRDKKGLKV